ncbi:hypothetical protein CSB37_01225 [bacterium DOLZORAL124_38_8]|nr:MAG: hypothetical protein CSB37_01225 [bacterium DOLZORAL124_38_8]
MNDFSPRDNFQTNPFVDTPLIQSDSTLQGLIIKLLVFAFVAAAIISAIFIFWGGISFILSGGNDEKIKKAVNTIRYAIIGLIITIISGVFVTFIGKFFGFDFEQFIPSVAEIKGYINQFAGNIKSSTGAGRINNTRPF